MNGRRLSVYTNTSHVQNVDAAAVPRMWALEDQLVTTQDILAEQLEARKQLERELATSKLEIERMRLELQQQQVQQQQQKEQEQEQAISTSGLDRADFPQAVDMDMPNDALEATDRFGDSPHTLISSQHKQTNSSDMSNSNPTDSPRRRSSSFFGTFVLPKTRSRSIQLPTPALHNLSNGQYPSSQSPSYSIQDTESEVTYDDISDELSVARQMNSKYRKELMSLHDALDISLQFVLSNAEKVMLQSDTELRSFYVLLPEASLPSPATPREPLKWQDFWPMEYVERLWDQDSEYDSDHDLPPQDYEVRGDNFAWWRFMTEFGAFQGMRTVRRKVSRGWELAQADAKLADAAEGEKVRLKMQQHRDLHFRHYHSRLGGGREIDHATQGLLTSDGGAAHPRYPQHSGVLSTQGLSSDENSKKTRNINCDSEHDSDLALKDLPQTLSGRAQYSQLTDNPDHNNHSSPAFTESPRDSRTGRHLSYQGLLALYYRPLHRG
ncbi:hypothetical protein BASA84_001466 [Batrachochytrium salamandrivorans]|nr:hypothetical protein BASA84_001466 [Batrachochytrium salamandrivorans]